MAPVHLRAAAVACYASRMCISALLPTANGSHDAHVLAHNALTLVQQHGACDGDEVSMMAEDAVPTTWHCYSSKLGIRHLKVQLPNLHPYGSAVLLFLQLEQLSKTTHSLEN